MRAETTERSGGGPRKRGALALALALGLSLAALLGGAALAGCGGGDSPSATGAETTEEMPSGAPAESAVATTKVEISDFLYDPAAITVKAGDTVTWTNNDQAPHTATADDQSFDTGDLQKGAEGTATFEKAGEFTYYCRFHAFMNGTVVVE